MVIVMREAVEQEMSDFNFINARVNSESAIAFKEKIKESGIKLSPVIHAMAVMYVQDPEFYASVNTKVAEMFDYLMREEGRVRKERNDKGVKRVGYQPRKVSLNGKLYTVEELQVLIAEQGK